ncbi:MAG: hypothetical protein H6732_08505 [Alphaproteobacteria bacterium]|nr:hypothetical protein [Alphaproteobacteria bacterium]
MSATQIRDAVRAALAEGLDTQGVLAAARTLDPELGLEEVLRLADELADTGAVARRLAPPTDALGRRDLLRGILAGSAAAAGVAVAVSVPRMAAAAEPVCAPEVDFRVRERQIKVAALKKVKAPTEQRIKAEATSEEDAKALRPKLQEERRKEMEAAHDKYVDERAHKGGARYRTTGPAPLWILPEVGDEVLLEVEQSSIRADVEGSCTVVMDLRVDTLDGGSLKEAVARVERLGADRGKAPLLTVSWGETGQEAFEGYLDSTATAYDAFLPDATPVRAVIRATFLIA